MRWWFAWFLCAMLGAGSVTAAPGETLEEARNRLWTSYRTSLNQLAEQSAAAGDAEAAAALERWLPATDEDQILLFDASSIERPAIEGDAAEQFADLRRLQADALFALAERAAGEGRAALAMRLVTEALREDPDHAQARRVLGFQQVDGQWMTDFQARMQRSGRTWHESFGWIHSRDVEKYEAGFRPRGRRWISAEEDAAARHAMDAGWVVSAEHFLLTTNHSLEEGVALAARLEALHAVWRQLFADYLLSPRELEAVFAGRRSFSRSSRPHQVWYFRTRDEYNQALRREQPRIDITLGIYFDTHRRGYFFAGEDQHPSTIVHEAVHQLFQESRRTPRAVGRLDNFWIIEGVATYFESLAVHEDPVAGTYFTLGGAESGRLPVARARLLEENYYVPLAELVLLGKDDLQQRPDLAQLYSQLAGLTTFFMQADDARYRHAVIGYLSAVYSGRANEQTLAELTGQSYEEIDRAYRGYLESLR